MMLDVDLSTLFNPTERLALKTLRERYGVTRDLLTDRELRRLRFLLWLRSRDAAPRD